jgi:hypothetical protein
MASTSAAGFRNALVAGVVALAIGVGGSVLERLGDGAEGAAPGQESAALLDVVERLTPERPLVRLGQRVATALLRFALEDGG